MSNGLDQKCEVSDELAVIVGSRPISRKEITKKLWKYIKSNGLQDPTPGKGQFIEPDEVLADIFGPKRFKALGKGSTMLKVLSKHIYKDE